MEGMDTPEQTEQTDARDLIHANFCAFQEQRLRCKTSERKRLNITSIHFI